MAYAKFCYDSGTLIWIIITKTTSDIHIKYSFLWNGCCEIWVHDGPSCVATPSVLSSREVRGRGTCGVACQTQWHFTAHRPMWPHKMLSRWQIWVEWCLGRWQLDLFGGGLSILDRYVKTRQRLSSGPQSHTKGLVADSVQTCHLLTSIGKLIMERRQP